MVFVLWFLKYIIRTNAEYADDYDIILAAVKIMGSCLAYASATLRDNEIIVVRAVKNFPMPSSCFRAHD